MTPRRPGGYHRLFVYNLILSIGCCSARSVSSDLLARGYLEVQRIGNEEIQRLERFSLQTRYESIDAHNHSSRRSERHAVDPARIVERMGEWWSYVIPVYVVFVGSIFSMLIFVNHRKNAGPTAIRGSEAEAEEQIGKGQFFTIPNDDLVDVMGLSGMTLLDMEESAGVSGLPYSRALPFVCLQAWLLQFIILFYMARRVIRLGVKSSFETHNEHDEYNVPFSIIFAAIYLHFINSINDLPYSLSIAQHLGALHKKHRSHILLAIPVFAMDGLVVPFTSLVVGALYLCTSISVADVILNSCAVAFISNIDNWILNLNDNLNKASNVGNEDNNDDEDGDAAKDVYIPVNRKLVQNMSWLLCVVPIVPTVFSCFFGYVGLFVLKL